MGDWRRQKRKLHPRPLHHRSLKHRTLLQRKRGPRRRQTEKQRTTRPRATPNKFDQQPRRQRSKQLQNLQAVKLRTDRPKLWRRCRMIRRESRPADRMKKRSPKLQLQPQERCGLNRTLFQRKRCPRRRQKKKQRTTRPRETHNKFDQQRRRQRSKQMQNLQAARLRTDRPKLWRRCRMIRRESRPADRMKKRSPKLQLQPQERCGLKRTLFQRKRCPRRRQK